MLETHKMQEMTRFILRKDRVINSQAEGEIKVIKGQQTMPKCIIEENLSQGRHVPRRG